MAIWRRTTKPSPTAASRRPTGRAGGRAPVPSTWFDKTLGWTEIHELAARLDAGDHRPIQAALEAMTDPADRELGVRTAAIVIGAGPALERWIAADGTRSAIPWMVSGNVHIRRGWEARGSGRAATVTEHGWQAFFDALRLADSQLLHAARLDATDPVPWTALITSARALQMTKDELTARYQRGVQLGGPLGLADDQYLQGICAKWSGSDEEMFAFARRASAESPLGSHRFRLIADAHLEIVIGLDGGEIDAYQRRPDVRAELVEAASRSVEQPGFGVTRQEVFTLNSFALMLRRIGELDRARRCHELIAGRYSEYPWGYWNNPADQLMAHREAVGLPAV